MKVMPIANEFTLFFLLGVRKDPVIYFRELNKKYGNIFHKYFKGYDNYFTCFPQFAERIMFTNQDNYLKHPYLVNNMKPFAGENNLFTSNNMPQWERDRQIANKYFEPSLYFDFYANVITDKCKDLFKRWDEKTTTGPVPIHFQTDIEILLSEIINNSVFYSLDIDTNYLAHKAMEAAVIMREKAVSLSSLIYLLPTKKRQKFKNITETTYRNAYSVINSRLASNKEYDDLLGAYIKLYDVKDKNSISITDVANHLILFMIVGYVTTAASVCWTLITLAQNPEVLQNISQEVLDICNGRTPTYEDYKKLAYTKAAISESLRLYPPIPFALRTAIEDDEIMNYSIPAHSNITINRDLLHRHPDFWENPEKFDPERFLKNRFGQANQFAYIPFGAGKRSCAGRNFAMLEVTLIIAMISQRYKLTLLNNNEIHRIYYFLGTMHPSIEEMLLQRI